MGSKYQWDTITPDPNRERPRPITEGIRVGTIRTRYSKLPPTYRIACEHCGHEDTRTEWQAQNQFQCYECHQVSRGLVAREMPLEPAEVR